MKISTYLVVLLAISATSPLTAAEDHRQHQTHNQSQLSLDHGTKWLTDEPLRAGMEQIHATMASNLAQIHSGELSTAEYHALAAAIQQQVTVILAQCRLKPEADANLHIIITDLLSGADTMQGKDGAAPVFGAHQVVESMHAYGEYFDHPGWRSLP